LHGLREDGTLAPNVVAENTMNRFELHLESMIFRSRWLLAPFFVGLIVAIIALLIKFAKGPVLLVPQVVSGTESEVIVSILSLVDAALIASLLLIITFSGYENFVSKNRHPGTRGPSRVDG
jgi:uncharacterized protein (TIGR00645 family)